MNDTKNDADILWALRTEFPTGSGLKGHAHKNYYHLLYVLAGGCEFVVDGLKYELKAGMHMMACPGVVHEMKKITGDETLVVYEIKFVVFDSVLKRSLKKQNGVVKTDEFSKKLIEALFKTAYYGESTSSAKARRHYLCAFLFHCVAPFTEMADKLETDQTSYGSKDELKDLSHASTAAIQYIEMNYMQEIRLSQIAEFSGYNKNYVCTAFKRDTGMSLGEYTNYVRIKKAAVLLSYSDGDLAQIAKLSGFIDISHFNKTFKKIVGIPPGQYRRSYPADVVIESEEIMTPIQSLEIPVWAGRKPGNSQ